MSHSTWSDVVPFVAHNVMNGDDWKEGTNYTDEQCLLREPESWAEGAYLTEEEMDARGGEKFDELQGYTLHGWSLDYNDREEVGKKRRLYGNRWRKGELSVWIINESEYSNVGYYEMAVCANDRASVEEFLKDWSLSGKIEETDSVSQSG